MTKKPKSSTRKITARKITAKPGRAIPNAGELPTKEAILDFVRSSPEKVGKREIARAFNIAGGARIGLKRLLAEMTADGSLAGNRRELKPKGGLPPVAVIDIIGRDDDGDLIAEPVAWDAQDGERPKILLVTAHGRETPHTVECGVGDRVLARITTLDDTDVEGFRFEAEAIRKLEREKRRLLGLFRAAKSGKGGTIEPIDRKELRSWSVQPGDEEIARRADSERDSI